MASSDWPVIQPRDIPKHTLEEHISFLARLQDYATSGTDPDVPDDFPEIFKQRLRTDDNSAKEMVDN